MSAQSKTNSVTGWFEQIKVKFNTWYKNLDTSTYKIIEAIAYLCVGFFAGFFVKKFAKEVILCLVILFFSLFLLDHFHLITIDWNKIREFTGISPADTIGELLKNYYAWLKLNIVLVISVVVGFLIGYKLG